MRWLLPVALLLVTLPAASAAADPLDGLDVGGACTGSPNPGPAPVSVKSYQGCVYVCTNLLVLAGCTPLT